MAERGHLPLGIFDSGMGGLSLLGEIKQILPSESFIYYADNLNSPYGNYSEQKIIELMKKSIDYLFTKNIKGLVIACNTVTATAVKLIRKMTDIPVIGLEPAVLPASRLTATKKILLLATRATLKYKNYDNINEVSVISCPCGELAGIIEQNYENDFLIEQSIREVLEPYKEINYDYIVLGCTHYVLKRELFERVCGEKATVIDGNKATAANLKRILEKEELLNDGKYKSFTKLIMTDGTREKYGIYKKILSKKH